MGSPLQGSTQRTVARLFGAAGEFARERGGQAVCPDTRPRGRPGQQSQRVHHPRPRFGTLPRDRAGRRPKVMRGVENNVLLVCRRPDDVPEPLPARYSDMMWAKDPPPDVSLTRFDVMCMARFGAEDVHPRFDENARDCVRANWGLSFVVTPGPTTGNPGGAAAASH